MGEDQGEGDLMMPKATIFFDVSLNRRGEATKVGFADQFHPPHPDLLPSGRRNPFPIRHRSCETQYLARGGARRPAFEASGVGGGSPRRWAWRSCCRGFNRQTERRAGLWLVQAGVPPVGSRDDRYAICHAIFRHPVTPLEIRDVAAITALTLTLSRAGSGTGEGTLLPPSSGDRRS